MNKSIRCALRAASTALVGLALVSAAKASTITITTTIVVAAGATYNGNGNTIKASGMGDGSQSESQKPFFKLNSNSIVMNVKLAAPGVDGCHFYGTGKLQDVTWQDIGEDSHTVKSGGDCWVAGGFSYNGADKDGQCNAASNLTHYYFYTDNVLKNIRQNGGTTYTCHFYYDHSTENHTKEAIGRTDSSTTGFGQRSHVVQNFSGSHGWWYGRDSQAFTY